MFQDVQFKKYHISIVESSVYRLCTSSNNSNSSNNKKGSNVTSAVVLAAIERVILMAMNSQGLLNPCQET